MEESGSWEMDRTDYGIVRELAKDGRVSDVMLGERVHLSATAAARRRKILEEKGIVRGYTVNLDMARLGFSVVVIVSIELTTQAEQALNEFEQAVVHCPSVSYCSFVSGDIDFLMIVHVRSFEDYDRVYRSEFSTLPHVAKIRSSFVMRPVLERETPTVLFNPDSRPLSRK